MNLSGARPMLWQGNGIELQGRVALGVLAIALVLSFLMGVAVVYTDGNPFVAGALVGVIAVVIITVYRIEWGFNLFLFMVFFFDQFDIPGFPGITSSVGYFTNLSSINYLPRMEQGAVTPMELHLLFILFVWIVLLAVGRRRFVSGVIVKGPAILFFLAMGGTILHGVVIKGGDPIIALWESRALAYLGLMLFFVPQLIQSEKQLTGLLWTCIAGISFKALQGALRYASMGFTFGYWPHIYETFTNHEDPVFFVTLFILAIAFSLFRVRSSLQKAVIILMPLLLLGFIAGQRRATYASFAAALLAFVAILPSPQLRMFIRRFSIVALVFGVYVGIFWNSQSRIGAIAQQFKATFTDEPGVRGQKDVESTFYRKLETYNLSYTFLRSPIVGIGFGQPFETPARLWNLGINKLGKYIPHNQIIWVFVKMGVAGAFFFWFFFNSFAIRGAITFSHLNTPYLKAVCAVCTVAIVNQLVVSFVDMQLTWYRNLIYLGILMGLVPVLETIDKKASSQETGKRQTS